MEWKDMSPADKRRWALEQIRFAVHLSSGTPSIDTFQEADNLIAYVERGAISEPPQTLSEAA